MTSPMKCFTTPRNASVRSPRHVAWSHVEMASGSSAVASARASENSRPRIAFAKVGKARRAACSAARFIFNANFLSLSPKPSFLTHLSIEPRWSGRPMRITSCALKPSRAPPAATAWRHARARSFCAPRPPSQSNLGAPIRPRGATSGSSSSANDRSTGASSSSLSSSSVDESVSSPSVAASAASAASCASQFSIFSAYFLALLSWPSALAFLSFLLYCLILCSSDIARVCTYDV
mmetsp:Transcript_5463/g.16239  ORF Transcript_5463/g.16239 Transcript_5463/m.16239 type:complete len:235 (+) Transcript_5463:953-1657(+)